MPKVGDKEFSYTPEGIEEARQEAIQTGQPIEDAKEYQFGGTVSNAMNRNETILGYGDTGNIPSPEEGQGNTWEQSAGVDSFYKLGGKVGGGSPSRKRSHRRKRQIRPLRQGK